jgi:hypothetical protein
MRRFGLRLAIAFAALSLPTLDHAAAEPGHDQISVVIPAVQKRSTSLTDADAALISYILAQSMKRHFLRSEGSNRSAIILVPAPVQDDRPATLEKLARINGAQIALSMKAFHQLKGALIDIIMVIPEPYRDFRTDPLEVLDLKFEGANLKLDVPSRYMSFPTVFLNKETIELYKADTYRKLCPLDRCDSDRPPKGVGHCKVLGADVSFATPTRYYEMGRTEGIVRLGDTCYRQQFPGTGPVSQPVIDFVTGVERFFAGDRPAAKERLDAVISSGLSKTSNLIIQAYLYLVRISIQTNDLDDAKRYVKLALAVNSKDPSVLETYRFLQFWLLARAVQSRSPESVMLIQSIESDFEEQPKMFRRPYEALLTQLKAKAQEGR